MSGDGSAALIRDHLGNWQTGWSLGAFGALAEFHQDQDETVLLDDVSSFKRATARGAIAFASDVVDQLLPIAYETLSPKSHRWSHAIAFCLPEQKARCNRRSFLTELGPDEDAILPGNRADILFDMGLSLLNCDFCIRTSSEVLLKILRTQEGRSLFEADNPAMSAVLTHHPHRVAITKAGRAEVFQKIGGPDTGGKSPVGPHTHVLPKLIRSGRTHTANTPIPEGLVPVTFLHPGNPVVGPLGEDRLFAPYLHDCFQKLLTIYGRQDIIEVKQRFASALADGLPPEAFREPDGRHARAALRISIRQRHRMANHDGDAALKATLEPWRKLYDSGGVDDQSDDDAPGHTGG